MGKDRRGKKQGQKSQKADEDKGGKLIDRRRKSKAEGVQRHEGGRGPPVSAPKCQEEKELVTFPLYANDGASGLCIY
jgi:hypothetical protein